MIDICPTVTASDPMVYKEQMERITRFAHRVHIDLADGVFAPSKLVPIDQVWWPGGMRADIHVMYQKPFDHIESLVALSPQMIIVHAEADGDFLKFAERLHHHGIEAGVALLPKTPPEIIRPGLELIDHALIFSGNLGYQGGGLADVQLLEKVKAIKALKSTIEIGWDGGVNEQNVIQLARGGVEVINVGSFIQHSVDAEKAYRQLTTAIA